MKLLNVIADAIIRTLWSDWLSTLKKAFKYLTDLLSVDLCVCGKTLYKKFTWTQLTFLLQNNMPIFFLEVTKYFLFNQILCIPVLINIKYIFKNVWSNTQFSFKSQKKLNTQSVLVHCLNTQWTNSNEICKHCRYSLLS